MPKKPKKTSIFIILFLILISIYACFWWIDSRITCEEQDEYSLRGACLIQAKEDAENGDVNSQWAYGDYLLANGEPKSAQKWYGTAMQNSTTAVQLMNSIGHCDKAPGFEHSTLESKIKQVAQESPDANLLLMYLYLSQQCGSFDLDKASVTIPLLSQCGYLAIEEYIRISKNKNFVIAPKSVLDIKNNLKICHEEIAIRRPNDSKLREIIPPTKELLQDFTRSVDSLTVE